MTAPLQLLVEVVEQDVRQQRRERPALRRPLAARHRQPVQQQSGLQVAADQPQYPLVRDLARHAGHQHVVVYPVEEFLQVDIDHPAAAGGHVRPRGQNRLMGAPPRPEAKGGAGEARIEQRHQHLMHRLLDKPVQHCRNPQQTLAAAGLGDIHPAHRRRPVAARQQVLFDTRPVRDEVSPQRFDRHPIGAGRALVGHHAAQRRHHVLAAEDRLHQPHLRLRSGRRQPCRGA